MRRLFFALWPNDAIRAELARVAAAIDCPGGRRVATGNLHVTLLFIGSVDDKTVERLCAEAASIDGVGFELHLDTSGWWRRSGIGWLAPTATPPSLLQLVEQIQVRVAPLGIALETRPYRPHLTICRRLRKPPSAPNNGVGVRWPVDEFALVESVQDADGARYEVIRRWLLGSVA